MAAAEAGLLSFLLPLRCVFAVQAVVQCITAERAVCWRVMIAKVLWFQSHTTTQHNNEGQGQ
jgi:hypothetical protein